MPNFRRHLLSWISLGFACLLLAAVGMASVHTDFDSDGVLNEDDNCPFIPNGPSLGTCIAGEFPGLECSQDDDCTLEPGELSDVCQLNQEDQDGDDVGDACDSCIEDWNPRYSGGGADPLFLGDQLDSDNDGFGNVCDGDFDQKLPVVGLPDLNQMRQALGKLRDLDLCPNDDGSPNGPCAEFDLVSDAVPIIGLPDLTRLRLLLGRPPGPKCPFCPIPNLGVCGNGICEAPETCFSCTEDCGSCCGNGDPDPGEQCDLDPPTQCTDVGDFSGGTATCTTDACQWDTSSCSVCGNMILEPGEECDFQLPELCTALGDYSGGSAPCVFSSCEWDTSGCSVCGNGIVEEGEECDLQLPQLCTALGDYSGGIAPCVLNICQWDTSGCIP